MPKFVRLHEAVEILETTLPTIWVSACVYRKKNGVYPVWYSSSGAAGAAKSYVDVEYLLNLRDEVRKESIEAVNMYYHASDELGMRDLSIAKMLAKESEEYRSFSSWNSFLRTNLFSEPSIKFQRNAKSRISEFHRIMTKMKMGELYDSK